MKLGMTEVFTPSSTGSPPARSSVNRGKVAVGRGKESGGQRVCDRLTDGLKTARLGLGLELAPRPRPVMANEMSVPHRDERVVSQSLRYFKEAFSALCKLGAGKHYP